MKWLSMIPPISRHNNNYVYHYTRPGLHMSLSLAGSYVLITFMVMVFIVPDCENKALRHTPASILFMIDLLTL